MVPLTLAQHGERGLEPLWGLRLGVFSLQINLSCVVRCSVLCVLHSDLQLCVSVRRLAKSTLLLIPLFGIHYVVFVTLSESIAEDYKIFFDLALGSFQVCSSVPSWPSLSEASSCVMRGALLLFFRVWWWPSCTVF